MFNRNEPAIPQTQAVLTVDNPHFSRFGEFNYNGLTKFEQCARDFTAALLPRECSIEDAVEKGILAAEEFCKQMEEREK
jgi:hypothetical protein